MDRAAIHDDYEPVFRLAQRLFSTREKFDAYFQFDPISHEELPAVRSEIRQTAERIFDNQGTLQSIVQRHEATIQKRWTNKPNQKRRDLLLTIWPNMARDHRPDIVLENKSHSRSGSKKEKKQMLSGKPSRQELYEGSQREALLMPYINLHDLTKTEPLLLMINARARWSPHAFCTRDLQLSTQHTWITKWRPLEGYFMNFDEQRSGPETYGELREGESKLLITNTGIDPRIADGAIAPGSGLWILEIQDRIYKFLLHTVLKILHDIPSCELTGPKYSIQPEPPLPSANSRADGVVSLATTNLEAIYSAPGRMDLHRLQSLVTAKANEEEDKLLALREDPGRFSEALKDFIAHRPEYVPDSLGEQHPTTTIDGCKSWWGSDMKNLEDVFSTMFLLPTFVSVEFWGRLVQDISDLMELQKQYFGSRNIESGDSLPEPFAIALYELQVTLCRHIEHRLSVLNRAVYSSPPLRPYVRRTSSDTLNSFNSRSGKRPPRHTEHFLGILFRLFFGYSLEKMGHIPGVQMLMEQYDMFISTVPDALQAVSSYVAQEISTVALLSECLRQIHLFQPWASTSFKEMGTPHIMAILMARLGEKERDTIQLQHFRCSVQIRKKVAKIAESPYPVHKKRTADNVKALQKAETQLDKIWAAMLAEMEQQKVLPAHIKNVLFHQGRQLQRTPDWFEPVKPTKTTPLQVAAAELLVQPFEGLKIGDNNKVPDFPAEKTKIKTRGAAAAQASTSTEAQQTEQEDQSPAHTIEVDRRALKVFMTLFYTASSTSKPGEVPWSEFLHAMRSAGFGMEKLQGSAWQFTPHASNGSSRSPRLRSILFHEPHPESKIRFWDARRYGRRLARAYGWSGETFAMK